MSADQPDDSRVEQRSVSLRSGTSRAIAVAMAFTLLALLLSRLSGLLRDVIVAYKFGTTAATDSFVAAFTLPDLISSLLLAGLVGVAVIPVLMRESPPGRESWRVANSLLNIVTLGTAVAAGAGALFAQPLLVLLTPGLDPEHLATAAAIARIMYPALIFFAAGSIVTALLNTAGRFTVPSLAGLFVNLTMIASAVVLGPHIGIAALAWGFIVGSALQLAVQVPFVYGIGYRYEWRLSLDDPRVRAAFAAMAPFLVITAFQYGRFVVERWLGSQIAPGTIAVVNFANRLLLFQPSLIVAPVATVLYPQLARGNMRHETGEVRGNIILGASLILVTMIPAAILIRYLAHPIVHVVYERGEFDSASANATAYLLSLYAYALIPLALNDFLSRSFFARRTYGFVLLANALGLLFNIIADIALIKLIGFPGMALGAAFGAWALLAIFVFRDAIWRDRSLQWLALKSTLIGIVAAALTLVAYNVSAPLHDVLLRLVVAIAVLGVVYFGLSLVLAPAEMRSALRSVIALRASR